ncbi:MAG TPA: Crp/Fnr family transcriptional regulator [Candidatus Blautia faecavium]|uniref:Crp/Fnr family transcriptional regulator n=1 Tax=Candidatus Blautia faecavium TaxID=2838487 RepID=A0A9D2LRA3_9FIRM|nr:Crp/Fnr family transcriptional regulator [Candidatus Blautia faecavium]
MNTDEYRTFFQTLPFWRHLTDKEQELLLSHVRKAHYPAGGAVQSGEQQCLGTLFLLKGILRVYLLSAQGKEATLYRLREGDVCTLSASCMLSAITFDVQIDAETDCDLLVIPAAVFSQLMKENIYVENFAYKLTTEHFSDVIAGIERTFFLSLPQRIAAFLLDEASQDSSDSLAITQENLARSIGSAREAVSRALKQLSQDGCIEVSRGGIRLLDKAKLYRMLNTY